MFFESAIGEKDRVAVLGHVRPDGDAVGACLAVKNYLAQVRPGAEVTVYMEKFHPSFYMLPGARDVRFDFPDGKAADVAIAVDVSDTGRLGEGITVFEKADRRLVVDHHHTNPMFGDENVVDGGAAAVCEILWRLFDSQYVDKAVAQCLYTGLVHDTGNFSHSNTSAQVLSIGAQLIRLGADASEIVEKTVSAVSFVQNKILGRALEHAQLALDGALAWTVLTREDIEEIGADTTDFEGIVDRLRHTDGTKAAMFLYESAPGRYKVSLRSGEELDVSRIAVKFGGGGHIRAAGCEIEGGRETVLNSLFAEVAEGLARQD